MANLHEHPVMIVMYHYVRNLDNQEFPDIKGLDTVKFIRQLDYIVDKYSVISMDEAINSITTGARLPDNAALLTFDDGYVDHYANVFPILHSKGIPGAFYPPTCAILDRMLLDVNKIHLLLASTQDEHKTAIYNELLSLLTRKKDQFGLLDPQHYIDNYAVPSFFDNKNVSFIKRVLQHALPAQARVELSSSLLNTFTGKDELALADALYMTVDNLSEMKSKGMHIGGHGKTHLWMSKLTDQEQENEIVSSIEMLTSVGVESNNLSFCFPYGDWSERTLGLLRKFGFQLGLTTVSAVAELTPANALTLARLDTNHLPQ